MNLGEYVQSLEPQIIQSLQESIRIPSVEGTPQPGKPFGEGVASALEHALETARSMGFRAVNLDGMIGYAEYGEGDEMIAVLGHLDVVPEGEGWTYPPYGGEIHHGILYGRGVLDNKGPIIGALWGLKAIKDLGLSLRRRIRIIFGTNEESGMKGAAYYAKHEEHPVMGFTPDAEYPIINVEKGSLGIEASIPFPENSRVEILELQGGTVVNAVPEEASLRIVLPDHLRDMDASLGTLGAERSWRLRAEQRGNTLSLTTKGKSAHGSTPELGENAVVRLFSLLGTLEEKDPLFKLFKNVANLLEDDTRGDKLGIATRDDLSGELTCNLGLLSWKNSVITLTFDIRHPIGADPLSIVAGMQKSLTPLGFSTKTVKQGSPVHVAADSELVHTLQRVYERETGQKATLLAIGGGTYAKSMPNIVAFGPTFPGDPHVIHQANECSPISRLMESIRITAAAMHELAG
jgi:succinyl-diaminopimelate desuccinylase